MAGEVPDRYRGLDTLTCAGAYVDAGGAILVANEAFQDLWARCGAGSAPTEGCEVVSLFAADEQEHVRRTLAGSEVLARPWTSATTLAGSAWTMADFVPIRRKSHPGLVWLVTLRSAQRMLDGAANEAARAALTAGVVHDLKLPLQTVLGWASLLKRTREPERIERALTIIERNTKIQMDLLDDLMELLRPSSRGVQLRRQPVDLVKLVKAELRAVEPLAEECNVFVSLVVDSPAVDIEGNETQLRRVVANLLGNALKFTPDGGTIECRVWRSAGCAGFVVRDNGCGIDPMFVPHVFDAFRQESGERLPSDNGWGLGLNVVRHLVELHGGTVTATSAGHGCGATFSVLLPAVPHQEVAPELPLAALPCDASDALAYAAPASRH